jgi:hypothetical protein
MAVVRSVGKENGELANDRASPISAAKQRKPVSSHAAADSYAGLLFETPCSSTDHGGGKRRAVSKHGSASRLYYRPLCHRRHVIPAQTDHMEANGGVIGLVIIVDCHMLSVREQT